MLTRQQDRSLVCMWREVAEARRDSRAAAIRGVLVLSGISWATIVGMTADQAEAMAVSITRARAS